MPWFVLPQRKKTVKHFVKSWNGTLTDNLLWMAAVIAEWSPKAWNKEVLPIRFTKIDLIS